MIELLESGQVYKTKYNLGKIDCVSDIVGTGTGVVTFCGYRLEPEIAYSQSSGHGEIVGYTYVLGDERTREFELSMDPKATKSNILKSVYGTDEELVILQIEIFITAVGKK